MPLHPGKSKKAFSKNVEIEMKHGKPQDQALAIAYSVKRKSKKKMAEGGNVSIKDQKRPMPDDRHNDSKMVLQNSGNKPAHNDSWTDNSTIKQAQAKDSRKVLSIKHPKMVPQNLYSTRLRDEEDDLQSSASPGPYAAQPPRHDDEEGANRQGLDVPDMADQHNNHKKPYNKAIEDQYAQDMAEADMKRASSYARGGPVMQPKDHGIELMEREDEAHEQSILSPSEDEGSAEAHSLNEEGPDREGDDVPDMEEEHSSGRKPYAKGGHIQFDDALDYDHDMELNPDQSKSPDDSEDQPEDEEDMDHEDSIAAAIMSKKQRSGQRSGAKDDDSAVMMADGGILSHGSMDSDDSDQTDLSRNADEDANEEDQASFDALRKENYSESEGLKDLDYDNDSDIGDKEESDSEDKHDKIDKMRSRMNKRRQFKQR